MAFWVLAGPSRQVTTLGGKAFDVGLVNAARWVHYLAFGVILGAVATGCDASPS